MLRLNSWGMTRLNTSVSTGRPPPRIVPPGSRGGIIGGLARDSQRNALRRRAACITVPRLGLREGH